MVSLILNRQCDGTLGAAFAPKPPGTSKEDRGKGLRCLWLGNAGLGPTGLRGLAAGLAGNESVQVYMARDRHPHLVCLCAV